MSFKNLIKIAEKYERLAKLAQETVQGDNDLVEIINSKFDRAAKNAIANEIVNAIDVDLIKLHISLTATAGKLAVTALVNGTQNPKAVAITMKHLAAKSAVTTVASKKVSGTYNGWITA